MTTWIIVLIATVAILNTFMLWCCLRVGSRADMLMHNEVLEDEYKQIKKEV